MGGLRKTGRNGGKYPVTAAATGVGHRRARNNTRKWAEIMRHTACYHTTCTGTTQTAHCTDAYLQGPFCT